jgi:hypothetical protein
MPGGISVPAAGDLYLLSGIKMPQAYTVTTERELPGKAKNAIRQMYGQKVSCKDPVSPLFFRRLEEPVGTGRAVIVEGGAIINSGSVELRIQAFTRSVNSDLDINIEISDTVYVSRFDRIETALQEIKLETGERISHGDSYTLRRFRDIIETMTVPGAAQLNFSRAINPVTVHTMQLTAGDESLQFRFVNSRTASQAVNCLITCNKNTKILRCSTGLLQYMTQGINSLASSHVPNEYKFRDIPLFESRPLTEASKK